MLSEQERCKEALRVNIKTLPLKIYAVLLYKRVYKILYTLCSTCTCDQHMEFFLDFMATLFGISKIIGILLRRFMSKHGRMLGILICMFLYAFSVSTWFSLWRKNLVIATLGKYCSTFSKQHFHVLKVRGYCFITWYLLTCFFKKAVDRQ